MTTDKNAIARTIMRQIGYEGFVMMGSKAIVMDGHTLMFDVKGSPWTLVKVALNGLDLYDVTFYGDGPRPELSSHTVPNVYNEDLRDVIARESGLPRSFFDNKD